VIGNSKCRSRDILPITQISGGTLEDTLAPA